ncbi:MAG TPA: cellulase family glycosylhydrolase [Acidimicrobiales bacterium]|nr:cellulase family glycosylhydrolase [Acidimicrobiales bacterium]
MNQRQTRILAIALAVIVVLGLLGAIAAPLLAQPTRPVAPTAPAGTSIEPWSQVSGTDGRQYIADQQGRALQFRGMNVKTEHPAADASDQLLADAAKRGFNLLRLSVYWDEMEPSDDAWNEAYFAEVQTVLERAEAHGIWVVLTMHQDNFNTKFGGKGMPDWVTDDEGLPFEPQDVWFLNALQPALMEAWENLYERPAFRAAQIDAWQEIVTRFHQDPAVIGYDLLNEPFGKIRDGENLVTAIERFETTQLTPMYQRLTTAIRAIEPKQWVFVEAPNQASLGIRTWLGAIDGGNIAFFPHLYDSSIESATYTPGGEVKYDPKFFDTYGGVIDVYPDAHHVPVLFGEWGVAHPEAKGMDQFVADAIGLMEDHGSGWTMFNGCRGTGYCPFDAEGNDRPGIGQIVQPYAQAIAGAPTSFHWDADAKTLIVVFTDGAATGTTDLVVPTGTVYPDGWVVETSDADGTWSSTAAVGLDPNVEVVSVSVAATSGPHAICLKPAGAAAGCKVPVAEVPVSTSTTTTAAPVTDDAAGAVPVAGQAAYTG